MLDGGTYYDYELVQLRLNWMLTGKKSRDHSIDEYKETIMTAKEKKEHTEKCLERADSLDRVRDIRKGRKK